MTTLQTIKPPAIARTLNVLLLIVITFLVVVMALLLIYAALILLPTGLRETAFADISEAGAFKPSVNSMVLGLVGGAVLAAAYLYVALVVRAIVKTTYTGNPFVPANISRLRKTWVVIALAEIVRMIVTGFSFKPADEEGNFLDGFSLDTHLSAWFLVFVIAIMAEVFRHGLELQRDQELTV